MAIYVKCVGKNSESVGDIAKLPKDSRNAIIPGSNRILSIGGESQRAAGGVLNPTRDGNQRKARVGGGEGMNP